MFLKFREDFWVATISKTCKFEVPKIFSDFFSPSFRWVLPVAWPRAAAPEAKHRCTLQPSKATIQWSSGSWRRMRPWMRRTDAAVASEEDLVGKPHEALGFRCEGKWMKMKSESGRNVDASSFLVARYQFLWRESAKILFAPTFGVFCCLYVFCTPFVTEIYRVYRQDRHVLLTIRSDHFIPKLITNFQHRLMNPDILTR